VRHLSWEDYERAKRAARDSPEYRRNRKRLLARVPLYCAWRECGQAIDTRLPRLHPRSATADHIVEVSEGGHPTALSNLQPMHLACNQEKERRRRARLEGRTARPLGARLPPRVGVADVDRWVVEEEP